MFENSQEQEDFFAQFSFVAPIELPADYEIYDFSRGYDSERTRSSLFGVGKYDEKRPGMYLGEHYEGGEAIRDVHVGIDIAAPAGSEIRCVHAGRIELFGDNDRPWDYGPTLITSHQLDQRTLYILWGHLSRSSLKDKQVGQAVESGEVIAHVGESSENGGWNPHLHFQLSWQKPLVADLPGVVSEREREEALRRFPDPRLVLGPLY